MPAEGWKTRAASVIGLGRRTNYTIVAFPAHTTSDWLPHSRWPTNWGGCRRWSPYGASPLTGDQRIRGCLNRFPKSRVHWLRKCSIGSQVWELARHPSGHRGDHKIDDHHGCSQVLIGNPQARVGRGPNQSCPLGVGPPIWRPVARSPGSSAVTNSADQDVSGIFHQKCVTSTNHPFLDPSMLLTTHSRVAEFNESSLKPTSSCLHT